MRTLPMARKILALAIALSLPSSVFAADIVRSGAMRNAPVVAAANPQFHQALVLKIDSIAPATMPVDTAITAASVQKLAGEISLKAQNGYSAEALQANTFIARMLLLTPEKAKAELAAANVPAEVAERLLAASASLQTRVLTDAEVRKAYIQLANPDKAQKTGVMAKAKKIAAALERAFKPASQTVLAEGGNPGQSPMSVVEPGVSNGAYAADGGTLVKGFVPVAKKVSELRKLQLETPAAAFEMAEKILADNAEPRVEVRVAALRVISAHPADKALPVLLKASSNAANWYVQRMAIQMAGAMAVAAESKDKAVETFKASYKSSNPSVRLMAKAQLEKLGVDPGPEPAPSLTQTVRGRVPNPIVRGFNPSNGDGPEKPKGPSIMKFLIWGALLFMVFRFMTATGPTKPTTPIKEPAAIEQVITQPNAADTVASKTPEQAMDRVAEQIKELKEAQQKAEVQRQKERAEDKAAAEAAKGNPMTGMLFTIALAILPIFLLVWLFKRMQGGAASSATKQLSGGKMNLEKPDTRFTDVAGADDALKQIQQVADYIRNPERYTRLGAKPPKGVMLHGPPGTGKTLMARALAGESNANFISMKGSDFIELFVGVGAGRVRELFETARRAAPTIIFIDELDAIGRARGRENISGGSSEHDQTLIALIAELDGFAKMDNVIVVAATNRLDVLDPALMRPGRFDRKIYVGTPDVLGREAILAVHGGKYRLGPDVDLEFTAKRTSGLAGAGMANILNEAATQGAMEDHDSVNSEDVAIGVDKETMGERRHLFVGDEVKARVAYHEAGHALAMMLANPNAKAPNKITIIPHGAAALGYAEQAEENEGDSYLLTMDQLEDRIVGAMGGRAAEELVYGKENPKKGISTGPGSDIQDHADRIARIMVEKLGMSEKVGIIDAGRDERSPIGGYKVSEKTREKVDEEVARITREALTKAKALIEANMDKLQGMVNVLTTRETIYQNEIDEIVRKK